MIPRYSHAVELIDQTFKLYSDKPAYTCMGKTLSFSELNARSMRFASYLQHELGLQPGDRFAIQLPNILQFPVALYGAMRAGLVVVNINPLYTPREIKHQLIDCGAKALIVLANVAHNAAEVVEETQVDTVIVTELGDEHDVFKRHVINFLVKHVKKMVLDYSFEKSKNYTSILASTGKPLNAVSPASNDPLMLQYTGGTTGLSKGAILTNKNLTSNVWQMITHMPVAFELGRETFVACLPLYHIYALNLHALAAFSSGCHNILIPNPRDFDAFSKALEGVPFTVFIGINTLFRALTRCEAFKHVDFSHLKITSAGGMSLTEDAAKDWEVLTGCKVIEGYGLTETSPVLTGNPSDAIRLGSIGKPLPETEIHILNERDEPVADGEIGELCARGPQVMAGYWNKSEETKKVMTKDGFFRTGDMAVSDTDGYYRIVDRKKDMILVSGFNVYPNEIEDVLTQHPDILEAAAVGVEDSECGERVRVFIVSENKDLTDKDVIRYCRKNLTGYKTPKEVVFRAELPKSNVGKILRKDLRSEQNV